MLFNIQRGVSKKYEIKTIEGENDAVGNVHESIWTEHTATPVYPFQSAAVALTIESDQAADTLAGTGAQKAALEVIDDAGEAVTHILEMNGVAQVAIPGLASALNKAAIVQGGSSGFNAGRILIKHGATIIGVIEPSRGKTLQAVYTIPTNKRGFAFGGWFSSGNLDQGQIEFYTRIPGGVWVSNKPMAVYQRGAIFGEEQLPFVELPPGTQCEIRAVNQAAANIFTSGGFSLLLEKI